MTKALSIAGGLVVMGLGVWGAVAWWPQVVALLKASAAMAAVLVGLTVILFVLSELKAPKPPREGATAEAPGEPQQ